MTHRKLWTAQEDEVISRLIDLHGTNQWTTIATEMKALIPSTRSSKQIRERWYNQLNPRISKTPWLPHEEATLFLAHAEIGNKWKDIAGQLEGRTDNAVKNHFYSTIRRALRRMDKHFGFKDSTRKMRNLKPSALTYFLQEAHSMEIYSDMMDLILQFAQWKPTRQNKKQSKEQTRHIYQNILDILGNYKQTRIPTLRDKKEQVIQHTQAIENESTESDEMSFEGSPCHEASEGEEFNYFGGHQFKSWFNMNEKEEELILDKGMGLPCDYHCEQ